jgi:hypothetical protein
MTERRTDGTSAFNTRTERRRLLLLDPARGEERLMEIQQHDGVVVEAAGFQQGFAKRYWRRKRCHGREREAPGAGVLLPCTSPLYIGVEGAGFLPSKSIGALAKVGGKKSHPFPSPPIVIPPF